MFWEQFKGEPAMAEEVKEKKEDESTDGIADEIADAPIKEVIDAVMDLPTKDFQALYDAMGKVIKGKKKEAAPKQEAAPEGQFDAQDMARSFM